LKNRKIGVKSPDPEIKNVLRVLGGVVLCFPAIKNGVPVSNPELVDFVEVVIQIKNFAPARLPTYIEVIENYVVKKVCIDLLLLSMSLHVLILFTL
jgi:hypothetical protein